MKKLLMGAAALAAMSTTPAFATDPGASYTVTGTVNATCYAGSGGTVAFGTIQIDSTTGKLPGSQDASTTTDNLWCNGVNSTLSFHSDGKLSTATPVSDTTNFTNSLDFTPSVSLAGHSAAASDTPVALGATYGTLTVKAEDLHSTKIPVAANDYSGTITVTLSPVA